MVVYRHTYRAAPNTFSRIIGAASKRREEEEEFLTSHRRTRKRTKRKKKRFELDSNISWRDEKGEEEEEEALETGF